MLYKLNRRIAVLPDTVAASTDYYALSYDYICCCSRDA